MNAKRWTLTGIAALIVAGTQACELFLEHYMIVPIHTWGEMDDLPERLLQ